MSIRPVSAGLARSLAIVTERDDEGALIGLARAVGDGLYALIVVVEPSAQRHGVGQRLVEKLVAHDALAGVHHTALFASPDVAPLYERLGFQPQPGSYLRR